MNKPLSIVFMGTPDFAMPAFATLAASRHQVVAVYTQPPRPSGRGQKETPSPIHSFALERGIRVYTPISLKDENVQAEFASHKADIAVVVAYGLLLPEPILKAFPLGCINIHPSALPRWRGAAPIQRTIMAGDSETKIIIMQMDSGLDTGDILTSEDYAIPYGMNAGELHDILAQKSASLLLETLDGIRDVKPRKQPETGVTYAKKITKDDQRIDWQRPAIDIYNQVLGLSPDYGATFSYNGEVIKVFAADIDESTGVSGNAAGVVADEKLGIVCGDYKILHPTILQRPNKKRLNIEEFINGFPVRPGEKLS